MSVWRDRRDAFVVHVARDDAHAERHHRDDRGLGAGVVALDVGRGIALGVTEPLRLASAAWYEAPSSVMRVRM